jgi:hypothetical protein
MPFTFFNVKPTEIARFVLINRGELQARPRPKKLYNYSTKLVIAPRCLAPAKAEAGASP